jgi:signal recognition particle subunit SEC65
MLAPRRFTNENTNLKQLHSIVPHLRLKASGSSDTAAPRLRREIQPFIHNRQTKEFKPK